MNCPVLCVATKHRKREKARGIGGKILVRPLLYLSRSNGRGMCAVIEAFGFVLALSTDMITAPVSAPKGAGHAHASGGKPNRSTNFADMLASEAQEEDTQNAVTRPRTPFTSARSEKTATGQDAKAADKPDGNAAAGKDGKHDHKSDGKKKDGADSVVAAQSSVPAPVPAVSVISAITASAQPETEADADTAIPPPDAALAAAIASPGQNLSQNPGQLVPGSSKPVNNKTDAGDLKPKPDHPQTADATVPTGADASQVQGSVVAAAKTDQSNAVSATTASVQRAGAAPVNAKPTAPAPDDATAISDAVTKAMAEKPTDVAIEDAASKETLAAPQTAATPKADTKESAPVKKVATAPATGTAMAQASSAPDQTAAPDGKSAPKDIAAVSQTHALAADDGKPAHGAAPETSAPPPQATVPTSAAAPAPVQNSGPQNSSLIAGGMSFAAPPNTASAATPATTLHIANAHAAATPDLDGLAVSVAARALSGAKQFDIRLDPPELGRVDVRLSIDASGKTQAHMTADQPQTLDLLQKDAPTLTQALRDAGLDVSQGGLNFSLRGQDRQANDGGQGSPGRRTNLSVSRVIGAVQSQAAMSAGGAAADARLDIHV
jgi:flagellar hook-length control protein FliK